MDLDLRRVRYFLAVAERLSFRQAADDLRIAQPALSRQVAALEQDLGVTLLIRDRRTVQLTDAGRELMSDARILLASAQETMRRVARAERGRGRLVVGFRSGLSPTHAIRAFNARRPEVSVEVRGIEWDEQERLITSGAIDIGFVRPPIEREGLRLTHLFSEPRLVALPADHPLAAATELAEADLAGERYLHFNDPVSGRVRLRSFEEKLEHVAGGAGIILLPESATRYFQRPDVVYRPVIDAAPAEVFLARHASRRSVVVRDFVEAAVTAVPALGSALVAATSPAGTHG